MRRRLYWPTLVLAVSCAEKTEPPVATRVEFESQPGSVIAGAALAPAIRVRVLDASGNPFTGPITVTLALGNAAGATLLGATSAAAVNGVARFSDLRVERVGTGYVLNASAGSLPSVASNPFDVTHAAAAKLRFVDPPTQTSAGRPFTPAITVEILDQYDNRATSATTAITMATTATDAAALMGTRTVDAVSGVATFDKISLKRAGSYSVTATGTGLAPATSASFAVELTARARFCPPDASSGASFGSFTDAIEATQSGGTIAVCDGTHPVTVIMNRPLTVVAEHPHAATLTPVGPDQHVIWVREGGPGTYAFRDLNFRLEGNNGVLAFGTAPLDPPVGRYDQVIIENNRFSVTARPGIGIGVGIAASSIPTAKVIVRGNTFTGGSQGVRVDAAGAVEISNNEFRDQLTAAFQHNASIELLNGGPYTVRNNVVKPCPGRCISATSSVAEISDNTLETSVGGGTQVGIEVVQARAATLVSRNVVRGVGAVTDRMDHERYAFTWAGLMAQLSRELVTFAGNTVVNARHGVWAHMSQVTGLDNTLTLTRWALATSDGPAGNPATDFTLHRSDVTDYVDPFFISAPPSVVGFASCNYWGTPAGPPIQNTGWYAPHSPVPIANRPEVKCP